MQEDGSRHVKAEDRRGFFRIEAVKLTEGLTMTRSVTFGGES